MFIDSMKKRILYASGQTLFEPMKQILRGQRIPSGAEVKESTRAWLSKQPRSFSEVGARTFIQKWNTTIEKEKGYVEV